MKWTEYHPDLKELYNLISDSRSEQISSNNYDRLTKKIYYLMEKLTIELNKLEENKYDN